MLEYLKLATNLFSILYYVGGIMNYGQRMKLVREYVSAKQKDVAEVLDLSQSAYQQFETQKRIIPIEHLNNFCNYYNISIDYVLGLTDDERYVGSREAISNDIFVERLHQFRKDNGFSQKKLAIKAKIPRTTIENYENYKASITTKSLYLISLNCNISADYLLGKIDTPINVKHIR